jgi:DHA3 family tetracycline resistance protein-like MFS transporter
LRSAQFEQVGRLVATPLAIAIAAFDLNLQILIAGAAMIVMAPMMFGLMSERGFQGQTSGLSTREILGRASDIFVEGGRLVRGSPLLMTIFAIAAFYGMAGEGFDRLWVAHFYRDLGFPGLFDLKPVIWIGVVRMGWIILSFLALAVAIKRVEPPPTPASPGHL